MENRVLEKFHAGDRSLGTFTHLLSAPAIEALAYTGLDYVIIELYIEIKDYGKTSGNLSWQTAYLYFPLSYIHKLYELYAEIEKAWAKDRSKTKPPKDKQSA